MSIFKNNTTIKIISVLFAAFLWFFVIDNANPISEVTFNIPMKIKNEQVLEDKRIIVKNKDLTQNISVRLKGRKSKLAVLTYNDIEATIDMAKINDINTKVLYPEINIKSYGIWCTEVIPKEIILQLKKSRIKSIQSRRSRKINNFQKE